MEYVKGQELFQLLQKGGLKEKFAKALFIQIVEALKYLHSQGIVHRDLKPENILLSESEQNTGITQIPQVKITDFGMSRIVGDQSFIATICGTPEYIAPELITDIVRKNTAYTRNDKDGQQKEGNTGQDNLRATKEIDIWSLGVVLFMMLSGCAPFFYDRDGRQSTPDDNNDESDADKENANDKQIALFTQISKGSFGFPDKYWKDVSKEAKDLIKKMLTVDYRKRITIDGIMKHPWLLSADINYKDKTNEELNETDDQINKVKRKRENNDVTINADQTNPGSKRARIDE